MVLLLVATWSVLSLQPPSPKGADAPANEFSAGRAMATVDQMAIEAHPTGSAANDAVRARLLADLTALGLDPQVRPALSFDVDAHDDIDVTDAQNIVAVIEGSDSTGRLFLAAHYDSAQVSPGAGDDASGVGSILEIARALRQGPQPRNDVVLLLTDAEEAGTLGSEGFAHSDPLAANGGVILNFEARGSRGPVVMFETSDGNADLARLYGSNVPYPVATSAAVEVYRKLRNNTDFTSFLQEGGFTGLNSAYFDGAAVYHTPQDTPSRLDRGSLQMMGDNGLALTRALADADLGRYTEQSSADETYFPVLGSLTRYPGWLVWPLVALAVVAITGFGVLARRRGETTVPRLALGWAAALIPLVLAPLATQLLWWLLVAIRPGYAQSLDLWRPGWYRLGVVALVVAVFLACIAPLRRRLGTTALVFGALAWLALLGIVLAVAAPGASYLTTLPALVGAIGAILALLARRPELKALVLLVASVFAVLVLAPAIALFFPSLGMSMSAVTAIIIVLLCFAILPTLDLLFPSVEGPDGSVEGPDGAPSPRWLVTAAAPFTALVAAIVFVVVGLAVDTYDVEHPEPAHLMYALDSDAGTARWVSESRPSRYTEQFLDGRADISDEFPFIHGEVEVGPAEPAELPPPTITVVSDEPTANGREVTVRVQAQRPVRLVTLAVATEGSVEQATVQGRALPDDALGHSSSVVTFHAPPADGVEMVFTLAGDGPVRLRAVDGSDGLTALPGFRTPPADVDIAGTHSSDLLMVATEKELPAVPR